MKQADFLIMDGSSILVRAFFASAYGRRLMQSTQGVYTNAVFGFLNMMIGALERVRPRYAFVAWDVSRDTFRRELYSDYKGTRGELPDELHPQFTTTQNVLEAIGIPQHFDERYEADDIIGTLAHRASDEGHQVLILFRCPRSVLPAADNLTVAIMKRGITEVDLYTPDTLREQYGLTPAQWIDLKGLMGDTSDNIPGVPGIGEKTALKLLAEYSSVEHLLENCHTVKGKLRDKLEGPPRPRPAQQETRHHCDRRTPVTDLGRLQTAVTVEACCRDAARAGIAALPGSARALATNRIVE